MARSIERESKRHLSEQSQLRWHGERMFQLMRPIDRVRAINILKDHINNEMDWEDVRLFFSMMQLEEPELGSGYSKVELIRGFLNECSETQLFNIANQLGLDTIEPKPTESITLGASTYWLTDHFRVFVSHVHSVKTKAHALKECLRSYGVSAFVAHDDIKVSAKWRDEILKSLYSMDACVAILTKDFTASKWTDQEVGIAVCRDVLIVPINKEVLPYGFIEELQAVKSNGMNAGQVAAKIFEVICESPKTKERMISSLAKTIATSSDAQLASFRVEKLSQIAGVPNSIWMTVRQNVAANAILMASQSFLQLLNTKLGTAGVPLLVKGWPASEFDDEVPF